MNYLLKNWIGIIVCVLLLVPMACEDDIDPEITELETSRTFAPVGLTARVRNVVEIELSWQPSAGANQYIIEFYQDSLEFIGDPVSTVLIEDSTSVNEIVYTQAFAGDTQYSARVKALSASQEESKWATVAVRTNPEQIFFPTPGENVEDTYVIVLWEAGSEVTNFLIQPGNIVVPISDAQKAAGEARIDGLRGATAYTVTIYNGTTKRGTTTFSTLKQANVTPLDDLGAAIDAAADGDTLILAPGNYLLESYEVTKSITIEGQRTNALPVIEGQMACATTVARVNLINLDFRGGFNYGQFFNASEATCNLGELNIDGCRIGEYSNNIIYNNRGGTYGDLTITNTYIYDIEGGGGDGFDFRGGAVNSLTVENTTITNGVRTLLRMQVPADVVFSNCTFYQVCTVASGNNRGFFRMSGGGNSLEVSRCLFVETGVDDNGTLRGVWSRAGDISEEVSTSFSNNYYFDVIGLFDGDQAAFTLPSQVGATEADPAFEDPANGDFSLGNQTLIDEQIGDARWWF